MRYAVLNDFSKKYEIDLAYDTNKSELESNLSYDDLISDYCLGAYNVKKKLFKNKTANLIGFSDETSFNLSKMSTTKLLKLRLVGEKPEIGLGVLRIDNLDCVLFKLEDFLRGMILYNDKSSGSWAYNNFAPKISMFLYNLKKSTLYYGDLYDTYVLSKLASYKNLTKVKHICDTKDVIQIVYKYAGFIDNRIVLVASDDDLENGKVFNEDNIVSYIVI